ncbi:MAG: hypothetical protein CL477_05505 [Acidobacteria bacterium]|jgi:hypothetical protein|nr:hypothetical protein [Acidobacteriota bacterium]|tara:strand:- start:1791 stop:2459 length:669 start_codon:yes stop_codon:yes gene_type:complete
MVLQTQRARFRTALTPCWVVLFLLTSTARTAAQDPGPIGPYVLDLRGSFISVGQDTLLAANRGLGPAQLAASGLGIDIGGHVYLFRWRSITFGVGASAQFTSPSRTPGEDDPDPNGPTVKTKFMAISPQLSFNFGHGDGWSYLSGGLGTSRLSVFVDDGTEPEQRRAGTLNYGGGARWFVRPRLAFSFDVRIFAISPLEQTETEPGSPRLTRMAFSAGVSFR